MKRLTARDNHGHAYYPKCFEHPCRGERQCCTYTAMDCNFEGKVAERLAEYEDTGLEPDEIKIEDVDKLHRKGNSILNCAKYSSDNTDEWYTTYETVAEEVAHYQNQFFGKVVLCNCDDPYKSNFCYYFLRHFNQLRLKKLICTSYSGSKVDQIKNNVQMALDTFDDSREMITRDKGYVFIITQMPGNIDEEVSRCDRI